MTLDFFPVMRSVLAGGALRDRLLVQYDLPQPVTCRLYSRYANDIYHVEAGDERFWLRVYQHDEVMRGEIEAEVAILSQLAQCNMPVVLLMQSRNGNFIQDLPAPEGMRYGVLTVHADGTIPRSAITSAQAAQYGQAVAQLHLALDELPQRYVRPTLDFALLLDEPLARLQPVLSKRPADWRFFCELATQLKAELAHLPTTAPAYGLCHGDLHKANVIIDEQGRLTIIDWDCLGYGWRAYELAVLRWSIGPAVGPEGIGAQRTAEVWEAYLQGYTALRSLTVEERSAIPYFVAVRQVRVLGWDVQRALDGRLGTWLLNDGYFDGWLGTIRQWLATECPQITMSNSD